MGEIAREFLGFERPFLDHVAERWCAALAPDADPSRTVFVLPGGRAVRELEARLAARLDLRRAPPQVVTEGALAHALARETPRLATPLESELAWRATFAELRSGERAVLWSGADAEGRERALARTAPRVFAELCAHALEPEALHEHEARAGRRDAERWGVFARATASYRARLSRDGLVDPADAARHLTAAGLLRDEVAIELVACVDLPESVRRLVDASRGGARAWILAPQTQRDGFDAHGRLVVDRWAERDVPLEAARWRVVHGPDAAANELVAELARLTASSAVAPRDVAVGVLDAEARPLVERRLAAAGVATRWAAGRPLATTALARLLADVERFLAERRFDDFRALLVHPDVEASLERDLGAEFSGLAVALDEYAAEACPARVGERFAVQGRRADELARAREALFAVLGPLATEARHPLGRWAAEVGAFVTRVFDEIDLGARDPAGWERAQSFLAFARILDELASPRVDAAACTAREALELVARRVEATDLPPPPAGDGPTLELFGWLELALDPAAHAVVVGFDEGAVPAPPAESAWLPERLRAELSLGHAAKRVARDAWIATVLASTRSTLFLSSRRSLAGDPRVPSRLAFRGERERVLERVAHAFVEAAEPVPPPPPAQVEPFRPLVLPGPPVARMRVTGFRTYLESPYRFYLEHVLELATVGERVLELDPLRFGILAHDALQAFGSSELASSRDADAIAGDLEARVRARAARWLDPLRHASVAVQLEQLVARLKRFARWQACAVAEGWRIVHVEWSPRGPVVLASPAGGMRITGRIDRIDRHDDGRWRVIDYKTTDTGKDPRATHLRGREWIDLQLPLYRHLVRELAGEDRVELGYVSLDASADDQCWRPAVWTETELAAADQTAVEVVEGVLARRFAEVGEEEPEDPIVAALCGFGLATASDRLDAEGEA